MNCNDPNNPDAIWKLVPANRIIKIDENDDDEAYVAAVTVCSQQLTIIESEQKNLLTMPTGSLEVAFYDGTKVKIYVNFENRDVDADIIKIYRNSTQTLTGSTYVGSKSTSENVFIDDLGDNGLDQTFYYYIQAISTSLNMVSRYRLLGSVSTYESPNILSALTSDEPENRVSNDLIWPITMGVPFESGLINENEDVIQVLLNDAILPSQQKRTLLWPDSSVKFLTVDFQSTINDLNLYDSAITLNSSVISHENPVIVTDGVDSIEINNNVISFSVSKTSFKGIENLIHNGQQIISTSDFYWINHDDQTFKAENFISPEVIVETDGLLKTVIKAEGFFKYNSTESMKFRIRFHVFAGLPYIKTDYTWIWTEDTFSNNVCTFVSSTNKVKLSPCKETRTTNWSNGQAVKFGKFASSTMPTGLNTSTVYYVRNTGNESLVCTGDPVSRATFTVHATANDATNNTNIISLGTDGTGTFWINAHTPYIKDIGLKFNTSFTISETNTEVDGVISQYEAATKIIQTEYNTVEISDGITTDNVGNIAGWVEGSNGTVGLACSIRDMKYESTKQFTTSTNSLSAHIVAPDGPNFNWSWSDRVQHVVNIDADIEHTLFCPSNPYGVAKTTEIWIWPTTIATNNSGINDLIQNPPCVITDPVYNCDTNAIDNIRPLSETPNELQFIENALEQTIIATYEPTTIDFKMMDYGDVHLYRSGNWRNWDNGGHGSGRSSLIQFYRTGKRIYKYLGEILHKHYVDVDIVNYSTIEFGYAYGVPKTKGWNHTYSSLHWAWGPIFPSFSTHKESLCWAIGLLGNERFNDSMSDSVATGSALIGNSVSGPVTSREQYGPIEPMVAYYNYSHDEETLNNVFSIFASMEQASAYTEVDGVIYNQQGQPIVPNNNFWYYYVIGLRNLYHVLEDEDKKNRIKDLVLKITADYSVQHSDYNDPMFYVRYYSSTNPHEVWYQLGQRELVVPYTFSYELTQNVNYLRNPIKKVVEFSLCTDENGIPSSDYEANNNYIQSILFTLGAWANENFRLDLMHGGHNFRTSQLATTTNSPYTWVSTYYFKKEAGVESFIRIYCDSGVTTISTPIYYRLTKPDFSSEFIQMTTGGGGTYYIDLKYEIEISNAEFDGFDYTYGACKLEILTQFQTSFVVQSNIYKFVTCFPSLQNSSGENFADEQVEIGPVNGSGDQYYFMAVAGSSTISANNLGGQKIIISQEDVNEPEADIEQVPLTIDNIIFNKTNGSESNIAIDSSKILRTITFGGNLEIDGVEPFCSNIKSKFFIPWLNINRYYPLLTAQGNIYSDNSATTNSVNDGVVAVWDDIGDYKFRWGQTNNSLRPILKTASINGHPAIDFSSSKWLSREGSNIYDGSLYSGTVFIVFKINALTAFDQTIFSSYYNDLSYESIQVSPTGVMRWAINSGGGSAGSVSSNAGAISANTTYVVTISANDTSNSYIMRINGVQVTVSGNLTGLFGLQNIRAALGCFIYNSSTVPIADTYFNGQIAEFRILNLFNLIDTPGKILEEEQKLIDKYL